MNRLAHAAAALATAAVCIAAAPGTGAAPVDGTFGSVTTLVSAGDHTARLVLESDAVLLDDDDARVDGHAPVEFIDGDEDYFALLISPEIGGVAWNSTLLVEDVADHGHLHMDHLGDGSLFEGSDHGYLLRAGTYRVAVLAGEPGAVELRLVQPSLAGTIDGPVSSVAVGGAAQVERREITPSSQTMSNDGLTYWGGAETFEATERTMAFGSLVARIDATSGGSVRYTFSTCDWAGDQNTAVFAPGLCASVGAVAVQSGTTFVGSYDRQDIFVEGFTFTSTKKSTIRTLGGSLTVDRPAEIRGQVLLFEPTAD